MRLLLTLLLTCIQVMLLGQDAKQPPGISPNELLCRKGELCMKNDSPAEAKMYFLQAIKGYQSSNNKDAEADVWIRWAGNNLTWREPNYPDIIHALEEARSLFQQTGNNAKLAYTHEQIGFFQFLKGKSDLAEQEYLKIVNIYQSTGNRKLHTVYKYISIINRYKGDFNRALQFALKAEKSMEETADTAAADEYYGELAQVYQELGQTAKSIEWYRKTIAKREERGVSQLVIYRTVGLLVQELLAEKKAREALGELIQLERKNPPKGKEESACMLQNMAYCYEALGEYELAEKYYGRMISLYQKESWNDELTAIAFFDIGRFYVSRQQFEKGRIYLQKALDVPSGTNTLSRIRDIHQLLFKVDSAESRYLSAIQHYQLFKSLNDSLFNDTKSKQIEELQIQYETDKLTKQGQLQAGELKQANLLRNVTLYGIALLIIITGLLFNRYRIKQKANQELHDKQAEIQSKNNSLQRLVSEKEWLLREIHHRVKNNLQIIMSLLTSQSRYLENDAALDALRNSQQRVQAISLIHQKLYMAENMERINMQVYIQELLQYLKDSFFSGKQIQYHYDIDPIELDVFYAVPVGLILNEAITNAIKYAFPGDKAGAISISFNQNEDRSFCLSVADNGIGISASQIEAGKGSLGMSLMMGLAEEIGGSFFIENKEGTVMKVFFRAETLL